MAIDLDGGDGLFDRLGKLGHALNVINNWRGADTSTGGMLVKELNDAIDEYASASLALRQVAVDPILSALAKGQESMDVIVSAIQSAAKETLMEMADADSPLPSRSVENALRELITQMVANPDTVDANEPTIANTPGTNSGNGAAVVSIVGGDGVTLQNALAEDIVCRCINVDTATRETFRCLSEAKAKSKLAYQWPAGSGANKSIKSVQATDETYNLVPNGDLEDQAANIPTSWTLVTGTAGTHAVTESSTFYAGAKAYKFVGDGSNLTQVKASLTVTDLVSRQPYAINFFCRNSTNPAAGVLTVDFYDGSAVINDDAGTPNSFTVDLTSLGTSFVAKSGVFRLPSPMPTTVQLRFRLSTAITNTHTLYFDHIALQPMSQLYTGGPYLAFFGGSTDWGLDDSHATTVTNDYRGAFQQLFDRLFDMTALGLLLPSATGGSETISDGLIA